MAQQVRTLATKPDDLSLIPGTKLILREATPANFPLIRVPWHVHVYARTAYTYKIHVKEKLRK